ncbi:MAG: DUF4350 domain-containing protein [Verrucomicrobiota bacterium]
MKTRRNKFIIALVCLIGLMAFGLVYIFKAQLESGEMYPEHSSYRADPRGTMILYESLDALPGVNAIRWHETLTDWLEDNDIHPSETTILLLDGRPQDLWDESLENFLTRGGRIIYSVPSTLQPYRRLTENLAEKDAIGEDEFDEESAPTDESQGAETDDLAGVEDSTASEEEEAREWFNNWEMSRIYVKNDETIIFSLAERNDATPLSLGAPESLYWQAYEYLVFITENPELIESDEQNEYDDYDRVEIENVLETLPEWETIYQIDDRPVVIGKAYGEGEVIVMATGLPLTNETMYEERDLAFIKWLLDDREYIVFDEYHFGIVRPRNVATLIREYGLELVIGGLLLSFGLFIWHGAVPLMPALSYDHRDAPLRQTILGGYSDLLRRHIPRKEALSTCMKEWKHAFMAKAIEQKRYRQRYDEAEGIARSESAKPRKSRNLSQAYQQITEILNRK